jgi:hypothetical protein
MLTLRLPVRSRWTRARDTLEGWLRKASTPSDLHVCVVWDDDDDGATAGVDQLRVVATEHRAAFTHHTSPHPGGKVTACNTGAPLVVFGIDGAENWKNHVTVLLSDDMVCIRDGWDEVIRRDFDRLCPQRDGVMYYHDGRGEPGLVTLPVVGWRWLRHVGHLYFPGYKQIYCDTELSDLARRLGRLHDGDGRIAEHHHPLWQLAEWDEMYRRDHQLGEADARLYFERAARNFDRPGVTLSLLIPSTEARATFRARLLARLMPQIDALPDPTVVQVCVLVNKGRPHAPPVGTLRNMLVERAVGTYCAFIDDDDLVSHDYIAQVLGAIQSTPGCDCVSLTGRLVMDGVDNGIFSHSIENGRYWRDDPSPNPADPSGRRFWRGPNHLNAVRREHFLACPFPPEANAAEDLQQSESMFPRLKLEAKTTGEIYRYEFRSKPEVGA